MHMETIERQKTEVNTPASKEWTIEITDLGMHQAFMGFSLSDKYLLVGITSPMLESQISINSIPDDPKEELKIPIHLEKCDCELFGRISFKGIEKILKKWRLTFFDSRFGEETEIKNEYPIPIQQLRTNTRSENLRLIGYSKDKGLSESIFELRLRPIL